MKYILHTDGGSRGNPGSAAIGGTIMDTSGKLVTEFSESIGIATNNVAEYSAIIKGLSLCKKHGAKNVGCFLDSELVVKQLKGIYKVKDFNMQKLHAKAKALISCFSDVTFTHVMRGQNEDADRLVNKALDER